MFFLKKCIPNVDFLSDVFTFLFFCLEPFDGSEMRNETLLEILRNSKEVAWKLPVAPMRYGCSDWIYLAGRARMGVTRRTLAVSGSTMHEGFLFRAICTMEL